MSDSRGSSLMGRMLANAYALTLLSTFFKILVRAGTFLIVAPVLGPVNQGAIAFNSSFAAVVVLLLIFGLPVRALRNMSADAESVRVHFSEDLRLMRWLVLPTLVLGCLGFYFFGRLPEFWIFGLLLMAAMSTALGDYCSAVLRATGHFLNEAKVSIFTGLVHFILVLSVALLFRELLPVVFSVLLSRLLFALISLWRTRLALERFSRAGDAVGGLGPFRVAQQAFPYAIDALLATILSNIDILVLEKIVDREKLGLYAAGSRLAALLLALPPIMQNVIIPTLSKAQGTPLYSKKQHQVFLGFLIFAVLGVAGLLIAGPLFTQWFLGVAYAALNEWWIYFACYFMARTYESYRGILMYSSGLVGVRVVRLFFALILIVVFGISAALAFGVPGFILTLSGCFLALGFTYPLSKK